ncbi:hypothetical protein GW17_00053385 [Ensete ventricosum]|nr:hypothetical protein GW17_00053385 [Ensete ventricosum]
MRRRDVCGCPLVGSHGRTIRCAPCGLLQYHPATYPIPHPAARNRTKRGPRLVGWGRARRGQHTSHDDRIRRHVRGPIRQHVPRRRNAAGLYSFIMLGLLLRPVRTPREPQKKPENRHLIHTGLYLLRWIGSAGPTPQPQKETGK